MYRAYGTRVMIRITFNGTKLMLGEFIKKKQKKSEQER